MADTELLLNLAKAINYAYAAGVIDGEGSIHVHKLKSTKEFTYNYGLRVTVMMTEIRVIQWLVDTFGGKVERGDRKVKSNVSVTGRTYYLWRLTGDRCKEFLESIRPYSRGKQDQIDLALEFPLGFRGIGVPIEARAKQSQIYSDLKLLHLGKEVA